MVGREHEIVTILQENHGIIGFAELQALSTIAFSAGLTSVGEEAITFRMLPLPV